ncbi:MAG: DUF3102 domain-containing protein [Opitutaceae bacterium]|nr:DUF3102 domain-containing protein [Opitutaceae bacterium]
MPKPDKSNAAALALINTSLEKAALARLQRGVIEEIRIADSAEGEISARRIVIGLALHRIKATLKHGEWLPWFKKSVIGTGYRNCAYAMRLAQAFVEKAQPAQAELAALPGDTASLAVLDQKGDAKKFLKRLKDFVGDKSFAELLDEHGLKDAPKLGGPRPRAVEQAAQAPDAEQLYLFAREEIGGMIQRAEEMLVTENLLQHLARHPDEVRGVVESLRALADKAEAAAEPLLAKKKH